MTHGHCLCGAEAFEFDGAPNWVAHCHCDSRRRNCSAPFTRYLGVADGGWDWTGSPPATYASSPGAVRLFCTVCGSPMAFRGDRWPGEIHFHAASLADLASVTPRLHVNWAEPLPWIALADGLPVK